MSTYKTLFCLRVVVLLTAMVPAKVLMACDALELEITGELQAHAQILQNPRQTISDVQARPTFVVPLSGLNVSDVKVELRFTRIAEATWTVELLSAPRNVMKDHVFRTTGVTLRFDDDNASTRMQRIFFSPITRNNAAADSLITLSFVDFKLTNGNPHIWVRSAKKKLNKCLHGYLLDIKNEVNNGGETVVTYHDPSVKDVYKIMNTTSR